MKLKLFIVTLGCGLIASGCNSLFYYPDALKYTLPEQLSEKFDDFRIPVGSQGETLHAWHLHSPVKSKKGLIVHFHGNAQNMSAHVQFVWWFLQEGYDLLTFDYRGYGQSDGKPSRENSVEDATAVLSAARQIAKEGPIFIVGQSLGGAIAVAALQRQQAQNSNFNALVLESSFHSYRSVAQSKLASFVLTWPLQWPLSFLVTDEYSPSQSDSAFNIPTLLIHGSKDPVVPYQEGLELAHLIQKTNQGQTYFLTELGRQHTSCFASPQGSKCKNAVLSFFKDVVSSESQTLKDNSK
ncbi:MAG: hypothetical protein RJB13_1315 [Pseudomonadota bacterium]